MLRRDVTFIDFDGNTREESHYFNMNKAEIIKWLTTTGDYTLDKVLERLANEHNGKKIMEAFDELIHMAYGRKSLDGRKFEKTEEIWRDFKDTEAYSIIFTEVVTDAKKAADFINAIIPKDLADEIKKIMDENPDGIPDKLKDYLSKEENPDNVVPME